MYPVKAAINKPENIVCKSTKSSYLISMMIPENALQRTTPPYLSVGKSTASKILPAKQY
jgi:hypothetical protein